MYTHILCSISCFYLSILSYHQSVASIQKFVWSLAPFNPNTYTILTHIFTKFTFYNEILLLFYVVYCTFLLEFISTNKCFVIGAEQYVWLWIFSWNVICNFLFTKINQIISISSTNSPWLWMDRRYFSQSSHSYTPQ